MFQNFNDFILTHIGPFHHFLKVRSLIIVRNHQNVKNNRILQRTQDRPVATHEALRQAILGGLIVCALARLNKMAAENSDD